MAYGVLIYKGYVGDINFDKSGIHYGIIHGIMELVNYEAETKGGLIEAFQEAVDYYRNLPGAEGPMDAEGIRNTLDALL